MPQIALLAAAGLAGVYLAARAGGAGAGLLAAIALACALALALRMEPASVDAASVASLFDGALLALPGILTVYFAFDSGGYFPASPALAALVLAVVLVLRVTLVDEPFAGFSAPLAAGVAALGFYAIWTLASGSWSHAPGRAFVEFDRVLAYLLLLVLFGSVPRSSERLRRMTAGLVLGVAFVAVAALATRLYPDRFPILPNLGDQGVSWPLTYANALGMLCVLGAIPALYFTTSMRSSPATRALAAATLPILAATVYLTLSRGPVAAAAIGITAFLLLGRPRGLLTGAIATAPASAAAIASAYHHRLLTTLDPPSTAAASQGHRVAAVVLLCALGAAGLRLALTPLDKRLASFSLRPERRRPVIASAWAALAAVALIVFFAAGTPHLIRTQYHKFVNTAEAGPQQDIRKNVFNPANRGLIANWSVALHAFREQPFHGQGAGMYEDYWTRLRPTKQASYEVSNGHSLYLETLGDLGLVGLVLLAGFVLAGLAALVPFRRGRNRTLYAALFATALAWAFHTGIDWDWQMPAVTAWFFAFGGAALAGHERAASPGAPSQPVRVTVGLLLLLAAITPGLVIASQRQLDSASNALRAGQCGRTIDRAAAAIDTLAIRPEPYRLMAICQSLRGNSLLAVQAMQKAVKRDPGNWTYHYELAVLQGGAGQDARPQLETANRLNPHQADIEGLLASLSSGEAVSWQPDLFSGDTGLNYQSR